MIVRTKDEWIAFAKEWKLGIFLFVNAIIFSIIFYSDISQRAGIGSREIIGDITYKYNEIERKFDREISWNPVDANSPVTNRDTVKTNKNSIAAIQLKDGTEIEMDEETMVILEISERHRKVRFDQGSINIRKKSVVGDSLGSITVESPKGSVRVNDGDVIVAKNVEENMNVAVSRGSAEVELDGQTIQLEKNQVLQTRDGEISAKNSSVKMLDPASKARAIENRIILSQKRINRLNLNNEIPDPATTVTNNNPTPTTATPTSTTQTKTTGKPATPSTATSPQKENNTISENKPKQTTPKPQEDIKKPQQPPAQQTQQEILNEKEIQRRKEQAEFERFMKM